MGLTATWGCWRHGRHGNLPENNSVTDRRYRAFCPALRRVPSSLGPRIEILSCWAIGVSVLKLNGNKTAPGAQEARPPKKQYHEVGCQVGVVRCYIAFFLSRLSGLKTQNSKQPRRHPKAFGTPFIHLLFRTPSSVPRRRPDACRAKGEPSMCDYSRRRRRIPTRKGWGQTGNNRVPGLHDARIRCNRKVARFRQINVGKPRVHHMRWSSPTDRWCAHAASGPACHRAAITRSRPPEAREQVTVEAF
jgi:hypothetical protein